MEPYEDKKIITEILMQSLYEIDGKIQIIDFNHWSKYKRRIAFGVKVTPGDTNNIEMSAKWGDGKHEEITVHVTSSSENDKGVNKYIIGGYVNNDFLPLIISGTLNADLMKGPHLVSLTLPNVDPSSRIDFTHEITGGEMKTVARVLSKEKEDIKQEITGRLIYQENYLDVQGNYNLISIGKEGSDEIYLSFLLFANSTVKDAQIRAQYDIIVTNVTEYRGKFLYERKGRWLGTIQSDLDVSVFKQKLYGGEILFAPGNGIYLCKVNLTPTEDSKFNTFTAFMHGPRFAKFNHSLEANFPMLQTVELLGIVDLRDMEDAIIRSYLDVNSNKIYVANSYFKILSMNNFSVEINIYSKFAPFLHMSSKAQGTVPEQTFICNLNIGRKTIIIGTGEFKRKNEEVLEFSSMFKYKKEQILILRIIQKVKNIHDQGYNIKLTFLSQVYTLFFRVSKEKAFVIRYHTKFCQKNTHCISVNAINKEYNNTKEWDIAYKTDDVEFSMKNIRESSKSVERYHTEIYKGDKRFGFDVRFGVQGPGKNTSLGIILPSREIVIKGTTGFLKTKSIIKLDFSTDKRNHPERTLTIAAKFENPLMDSGLSKFHLIISHPIFKKPINVKLFYNFDPLHSKYLTAEGSLDYSFDPADTIIARLSVQDSYGSNLIILKIYHKDRQNLDDKIEVNSTFVSSENTVTVKYKKWVQENGAYTENNIILSHLKTLNQVYFAVHKPNLHYKLDMKITPPGSLLNNTYEVDFDSVYEVGLEDERNFDSLNNTTFTKGRSVLDYDTGCYKITVTNNSGEISRNVELCVNFYSRKLLSLLSEGTDEKNERTLQYLLEIVRKDGTYVRFRQQITPQFDNWRWSDLTFIADIIDGRLKKDIKNFNSKVSLPFAQVLVTEAKELTKDIEVAVAIFKQGVGHYYSNLPSYKAVKKYLTKVKYRIDIIEKEVWDIMFSYFNETCGNNSECIELVRSCRDGDWKSVLSSLWNLSESLRGSDLGDVEQNKEYELEGNDWIYRFDDDMSLEESDGGDADKMQQNRSNHGKDVGNNSMGKSDDVLDWCGKLMIKVLQSSKKFLQPVIHAFETFVPSYYYWAEKKVTTNEFIQTSFKLLKKGSVMMKRGIESLSGKMIIYLRRHLEDCWPIISSSSKRIIVHQNDTQKGLLDADINHRMVSNSLYLLSMVVNSLSSVKKTSAGNYSNFDWSIVSKFKKIVDLDFIPPYDVQATVMGNHHFITFDKAFYDFAGECSYLLARDFEDGNFTVVLKANKGEEPASVLVLKGDTSVEISSGRALVIADAAVQLPYLNQHISVTREGNSIVVSTKNGFRVKCNTIREICTFRISGWYYGKTGGLLGTYNYEEHDELERPTGVAAVNLVSSRKWEFENGCRAPEYDVELLNPTEENDLFFDICKTHFGLQSSPLSACFEEVSPEKYFRFCMGFQGWKLEKDTLLCKIAAAYATECEKNYVELNLPSECIKCDAPDASILEHGDRRKFDKLNQKSVDTVFIVEDHECNKILAGELRDFARSVENELQKEGFNDNMFGVVAFGGDIGDPQVFTAKDMLFFSSGDVAGVSDMLKLESKEAGASKAFEAIKYAVTHLSRSANVKSFILLSCSACKSEYTWIQYPVVQQMLLERGSTLHVIKDYEIAILKSSVKEKNIIGVDPDTVFFSKHVEQKNLVGEPDLRHHLLMPRDFCVALSQDVNGSFFSTHSISQASPDEIKDFKTVFSRKFSKSVQFFSCQWCECTSTRDHLPNTVCEPCEIERPRLPFFIGGAVSAQRRILEAFISYLFHLLDPNVKEVD